MWKIETRHGLPVAGANIQGKISSCVYLNKIGDNYYNCGDEQKDLYYDHDKLMTFLLTPTYGNIFGVSFSGNNIWPDGMLNTCLEINQSAANLHWYGAGIAIVPDQDAWRARVDLRQPPDLCWAVYESCSPAQAEAICGK
ncbi:MAG: hypothetical protein HYV03_05940 [Deltaproteobacteria bacterium]|nr:hypothetical protein [Deltaproteobacteria bacterium]